MRTKHHLRMAVMMNRALALTATFAWLTGCAAFQGGNLTAVKSYPAAKAKKSMDLDFKASVEINGYPAAGDVTALQQRWAKKCVERLRKSGYFTEVGETVSTPDLKLNVVMCDNGEANMGLAFLTGLTLYIIPSTAKDTFSVKAILTDTKTGKARQIDLEASVILWQEILLLPLAPFKTSSSQMSKCQNKIFDNLALEIQKSGALDQ